MQEAYVKLEQVTKVYHVGEVDIHAVDGIDFEVQKGEFVVIVGPSGAGKTTVFEYTWAVWIRRARGRVTSGRSGHCKVQPEAADRIPAGTISGLCFSFII